MFKLDEQTLYTVKMSKNVNQDFLQKFICAYCVNVYFGNKEGRFSKKQISTAGAAGGRPKADKLGHY